MTSRGHPSISPSDQIPQQQRHNSVSNTPPPAQYYQAIPQAFEYPQQPQHPYKAAYGSAINDSRTQGNSARVGPTQQAIPQGGSFYQQTNQGMRNPQPPPAQPAQQYYISAQPQGGRLPRPPQLQSPVMYNPPYQGNNVIIVPNMYAAPSYQRVPLYQPNPAPNYAAGNIMYFQNGWPNQPLQQTAAPFEPQQRKRKVLEITDPNTGRSITEELFNKSHTNEADEHHEEPPAATSNEQDMRKQFTRLVADRLKPPEDSSAAVPVENQTSIGSVPTTATQPSQQYQQPPQQVQQQQSAMMHNMHPSMRPAIIQQPPAPATPPDLPAFNVNVPPPSFRQPTPPQIFNPQQPNSIHPIRVPPQQQVRSQMPHVINQQSMNPLQQHSIPQSQQQPIYQTNYLPQQQPSQPLQLQNSNQQSVPLTQQPATQHQAIPLVQPVSQAAMQPVPVQQVQLQQIPTAHAAVIAEDVLSQNIIADTSAVFVEKPTVIEAVQHDIPTKPPTVLSPPVKDEFISNDLQEASKEKSKISPPASKEATPGVEEIQTSEEYKDELQGASQAVKDARKGKKKKDFNRKELVGSDMDAFMDQNVKEVKDIDRGDACDSRENNTCTVTSINVDECTKMNQKVQATNSDSEKDKVSERVLEDKDAQTSVAKDIGLKTDCDSLNNPKALSQKELAAPAQVESKHKLKKKKKKKGRKTPPIQKTKQSTSANSSEANIESSYQCTKPPNEASQLEEKENEASDISTKPPLPPSHGGDNRGYQDKIVKEDTTAVENTHTTKVSTKEESPEPALSSTAPALAQAKTVTCEKALDSAMTPTITISLPVQNQNQPPADQLANNIKNNYRHQIQAERQNSKSLDNGTQEATQPDATPDDAVVEELNELNEELEAPKDMTKKIDDVKKGQSNVEDGTKVDKNIPKIKKDKEKLIYDRAYLMELRECPSSLAKPEGLPNLEIILDKPTSSNRTKSDVLDFTPAFFQQTSTNRHPPQIGKSSSRGRQRPGDVPMPQRIIKSYSLSNDVKPLHQSEKPWKPTPKQLSAGEIAEKRKSLEAEILFIMNRLTPTNFERLAVEMRGLNITTYEDLQELVKIFFDKVTIETKFVEAYALLCKIMAPLKVPPPANMKDNQSTFRVVMLTKCQQEFEADKAVVFEDPEEKKKKIESEMPEGPERTECIENTLYQMKMKRLKFYGNIRFIGELFKLGMLTENIMHDCIYRLLKARDDDSLVSLCNLLTTVGQLLDTDKAKTRMDQYFAQMSKIAEERKSRIKFILKDAIDLRSNNWVPRKEQAGPKKIDEVHKDFQQEQFTKQLMQSQPPPPRNDNAQPNSRRGSRQRQEEMKQPLDDGWNTVGSKSLRIDASKMRLSKNVVDENSIQLGPGGGTNKFSMWSRGSYGGAQPSTDDRPAPATNRFSLLRGEEDRRNFQRSPSRGDSVSNRGMRQGPTAGHGRGKILTRSSNEGERRETLGASRPMTGGRSQNSSRDSSWNRDDHRPYGPRGSREGENVMTRSDISLRPNSDSLLPPTTVSPVPGADDQSVKKMKPLSREEMENKAKIILEEFLSVKDLEEAKLCLKELEGQTYLEVLVSSCINDVLEKSKKERDITGQFFHEMVKNNLIPCVTYFKGLSEILQFAEDMVIDIPMIWTYLAQLIVPVLIGGSVPWSDLIQVLQTSLEKSCCLKLLTEILLHAKIITSEADVARMWQSSNLEWSQFVDQSNVTKFLEDKKLQFTIAPVNESQLTVPTSGISDVARVISQVEKMLKENEHNDAIKKYINEVLPESKRNSEFIRGLMSAVAGSSITGAMKTNEDVIKARKDILQQYIKTPQMELQALYAIQALMHKLEHPSGVIFSLFNVLYDEDVISEETFKSWEISTDPSEAEGKGACSMQLTQFFTWLRENEDPEADTPS
ncbi:eukaryotic translation initiation factor 4 gamma 3-like isoform X2 [Physella acuta]|uniref:eukaryotic translation initiation factor 4 gamma 3-like isoform X2 n=1 Tax=Physella acuta TaxID=109671 RepID=UPI0027DCF028|nr:eukaryotic translation initiation factor 4 gamma 3-like isoform X2 [Physella acuta]